MKTLGQIFRERRLGQNRTLEQASTDTRIRAIYLQYLEDGNYTNFPVSLQIKGFISIYARYLGMEAEEAWAFYRREQPQKEEKTLLRFKIPSLKTTGLRITSQMIITLSIILMIGGAVSYVTWQYINFAGAPKIELFSPRDGLVTTNGSIKVEGVVSEDSRVTLNNTSIRTSNEGYFAQDIPLSEGINVLTFVAVNTSGKSTTLKRVVRFDEAD